MSWGTAWIAADMQIPRRVSPRRAGLSAEGMEGVGEPVGDKAGLRYAQSDLVADSLKTTVRKKQVAIT